MKKIISIMCALIILTLNITALAFSDTAGHWAENHINEMSKMGYLNGYPDGTFMPNKPVTRAEFLKIITLRYGLTQNKNAHLIWNDVTPNEWYSIYASAGLIIPIYEDENLHPSEPLQRYEAAYALVNIYNIDISNHSNSASIMGDYSDYSSNSELCDIISAVIDKGLMKGKGDGFKPYDSLSRAELCTLLNRLKNDNSDITELNDILDNFINDNYVTENL